MTMEKLPFDTEYSYIDPNTNVWLQFNPDKGNTYLIFRGRQWVLEYEELGKFILAAIEHLRKENNLTDSNLVRGIIEAMVVAAVSRWIDDPAE